mgnify:CR=1 FL=1
MVWEIEEKIGCEVHAYSGQNCSGNRKVVEIYPSGREGDFRADQMRSLELHAPLGIRFVLMTAPGPGWEKHPWRAIVMTKGDSIDGDLNRPCVRIPHLEVESEPGAWRYDPDFMSSYAKAADLDDGHGWTYGMVGPLEGRIRGIRIDRVK